MKVAVIGAGWAGMAAAIAHTQAGHQITVFEAARTVGGRARAVPGTLPDGSPVTLDNGQHILIGAYATSLRLMRLVGVDTDSALLRLPLTLQFPDGQGLQLPDLPPPLDALLGIARAKGWHWRDKLALLRTATGWQLRGFRCAPQTSVAELCAALTPRLMAEFIDPLCVSALNTPACEASGQVFLRVLQDSLFSGRGGSNLLLPRTDLGALFAEAAGQWLQAQGGTLHSGYRVQRIARGPAGSTGWRVDDAPFDAVVLATTSTEAARLVLTAQTAHPTLQGPEAAALQAWARKAQALRFTAITTVYAQTAALPQEGTLFPYTTLFRSASPCWRCAPVRASPHSLCLTACSWAARRACWPLWSAPARGIAPPWSGKCCSRRRTSWGCKACASSRRLSKNVPPLPARPRCSAHLRPWPTACAPAATTLKALTRPRWKAQC